MSGHVEILIGDRKVGYAYDPLVIAEIGINHEGSLALAIEISDAAINAGAEVIKHQTHIVEDEMSEQAKNVIPSHTDVSIYEIMARCALGEEDEIQLMQHVESRGAIFLSTPFSRAAADRLKRMGVSAIKIGSGECNNYPLLSHIAEFGKPVILSTGMNDIASVSKAVGVFRKRRIPFALLHCTNVYPTPDELIRLAGIQQLQNAFPDAVIGLSDHSVDNLACLGGVALGAAIVERHFVDNKLRSGPDIPCSMNPSELSKLIEQSQRMSKMRGGDKGPVKEEASTIAFAYASVVAVADIQEGDVFTSENIWVKRPGTGDFLAENYNSILGKTAKSAIAYGEQIRKESVDGLD